MKTSYIQNCCPFFLGAILGIGRDAGGNSPTNEENLVSPRAGQGINLRLPSEESANLENINKSDSLLQEAEKYIRLARKQLRDKMDFTDFSNYIEAIRKVVQNIYGTVSVDYVDRVNELMERNGSSVQDYRSNYPGEAIDMRPKFLNNKKSYLSVCHGTKFASVLFALLFSNKQLLPGIKARELGIPIITGESGGVTELNADYVSVAPLGASQDAWTLHACCNYTERAVFLEANDLELRKLAYMPALVFGENELVIKYNEERDGRYKGEDYIFRGRGQFFRVEVAAKRLNIRLIVVPKEDKMLVLEILKHLEIYDIKVTDFDSIKDKSLYKGPSHGDFLRGKLDVLKLWEKSEVISPPPPTLTELISDFSFS